MVMLLLHLRRRKIWFPEVSGARTERNCPSLFLFILTLYLLADPIGRKIDVMKYLGQCTIDVIGIAGFNYDFKALSQPTNELADAFSKMFAAGQSFSGMAIIQTFVPGASRIPTKRTTTMKASQEVTQRIGRVSP